MRRWAITIDGPAVPKGRPRLGRGGYTYTPKRTRDYERMVEELAMVSRPPRFAGPVSVTIIAQFKPPKSWSGKKAAAHMGRPHSQRPDLDNIAKSITDALNEIAYVDDSKICEMKLRKEWGPADQVSVIVEELPEWHGEELGK